jgi:hypothetical protein
MVKIKGSEIEKSRGIVKEDILNSRLSMYRTKKG